jgi:superfamily II DNA or RNA helicase
MIFKLNENNTKLILVESTKEEYHQLKLYLDRFVHNYKYKIKHSFGKWDGKVNLFKNGFIDFGLWFEVKKCCEKYGYPFIIQNKEKFPINKDIKKEDIEKFCRDFFVDHKDKDGVTPFSPREHQINAIYKLFRHKFGLIEVATSGGKSLIFSTMVFYYLKHVNPDGRFLLIVPSMDLVTQFYNDIMDYNFGFNKENKNPFNNIKIDEIFSDKPRKYYDGIPNIYIGTYQSLVKWPPAWFKQFNVVCCDEGHYIRTNTITNIMNKTFGTADIRFGMSGTFPDENLKPAELYSIESLTGPILYKIGAKELMDKGIISNVKINCLIINHDNTEFAHNVAKVRKIDGKKAWELEKKFVQSSLKRKLFLTKLLKKFKQNSIILFHNLDYGTELYNYFRDNVENIDFYHIDGHTPKDKRSHILNMMEDTTGNVKILVASYGTLSTGVNIRSLTNMVFADSFKSDRIVRQSIGRVLRLHDEKNKAIVFDIVDRYDEKVRNTLYDHYLSRKKDIYDKQNYYYTELKITI